MLAVLWVLHIPGFKGAHSQGVTLEKLTENLKEVIEMVLEDNNFDLQI